MTPSPGFRLAREGPCQLRRAGRDDAHDRQVVFGREFKVALVMARHRHDRAGAVIHQHEIGDLDRQVLARERMRNVQPGVETQLFRRLQLRRGRAARAALLDEGLRLVIGRGHGLRDRMLRRDGDEARAEDRVGPGGIDLDRRRRIRCL